MSDGIVLLHGSLWLTVDSITLLVHDSSAAHLELDVTINAHSFRTARSKSTSHDVAYWNEHFLFPIDAPSTSAATFSLFDVRAKPRRIAVYNCALSAFALAESPAPTVQCKLRMDDGQRAVGVLNCRVRWQSISRHTIPLAVSPQTATSYPTTYSGAIASTSFQPSPPLSLRPQIQPQSPPPPYEESVPPIILSALALINDEMPFRLRHCASDMTAHVTTAATETATYLKVAHVASQDSTALRFIDNALIHIASHRALTPATPTPTPQTPLVLSRERYHGDEEGAVAADDIKFTIHGNRIIHCASGLALTVRPTQLGTHADGLVTLHDIQDYNAQWKFDII